MQQNEFLNVMHRNSVNIEGISDDAYVGERIAYTDTQAHRVSERERGRGAQAYDYIYPHAYTFT